MPLLSREIIQIGSNSSESGFGIRKSTGDYVEIPYLVMSKERLTKMCECFSEFLEYLRRSYSLLMLSMFSPHITLEVPPVVLIGGVFILSVLYRIEI